MNWIILIIAGFFEIGFTTCLGKAKDSMEPRLPLDRRFFC
jgi:multidrug transporter EmrE-like cation transporter